jgi:hypothetical protein
MNAVAVTIFMYHDLPRWVAKKTAKAHTVAMLRAMSKAKRQQRKRRK